MPAVREPAAPEKGRRTAPSVVTTSVGLDDIRRRVPPVLLRATIADSVTQAVRVLTLVTVDLVGLAAGVYLALVLRELWTGAAPDWEGLWETAADWLGFLGLVIVLVFAQAGLYAPRDRRPGVQRVASSVVLVGVLALAFALGTGFDFDTYGIVPTSILLTAVFVGALRWGHGATLTTLERRFGIRQRVVLVGAPAAVEPLQRALSEDRYAIAETLVPEQLGRELHATLGRQTVDEIIVAETGLDERKLRDVVDTAHRRGIKVRIAPSATELLAERAQILPGHVTPLIEVRPPVLAGFQWLAKRTFDIGVSLLVLLIGLPLWLAIAGAVKLSSRGSVLYRDRRVGLHEREFEMLKFRTMAEDAPRRRDGLLPANEAGGALFKIKKDPRITRVGYVLRRLSLDEVPQTLNVLRGEMSLVGPRPLPVTDYAELLPWQRRRSLVLPGVTGLWQISGRADLGVDELIALDFHYVERWSIWLDAVILLKTVPAVIRGRGAY